MRNRGRRLPLHRQHPDVPDGRPGRLRPHGSGSGDRTGTDHPLPASPPRSKPVRDRTARCRGPPRARTRNCVSDGLGGLGHDGRGPGRPGSAPASGTVATTVTHGSPRAGAPTETSCSWIPGALAARCATWPTTTFAVGSPADADVDAYVGAARTWDYFLQRHGRHGIHDDGTGPRLFTDVGPPDGEFFAQYDPECGCMLPGPAAGGKAAWNATDVVAHEMTHGITGMTAGLDLNGEAGGLHESTSDILATLVEFSANSGKDRPDYTIGEGVGDGDEPNHQIGRISNEFFYQLAVGSGQSTWGKARRAAEHRR
ncbi:M4 family metallopeptidase [Streptomyces sp. NBC_01278]|uniref:M4 family metallopeptidase n=1 Tax=Streptomyces sp. NBC_01278 TaxID=2903809 RepID=UPI002E358C78|nr:M4 family metallopeptidase [Streptomyces sp. NBC_01278]